MAKRIIMAGVLGGLAMYVWTSLAHVVLPLGSIGVSSVSKNEESLLASMHASLGETDGFYIFPSGGDTSYPGIVWHDGKLWMSYYSSHEGKARIYRVKWQP